MIRSLRLLSLLFTILPLFSPYKILVYNPRFGHSHSGFMGRIADTLVDAGHNVTSLIHIMNPSIDDGTQKSHKIFVEADPEVEKMYKSPSTMNPIERNLFNPLTPIKVAFMFSDIIGRTCKKFLAEPGLIERLREENYDVFIAENAVVCGIGISAAIKPRSVVGAASTCLYGPQFEEYGVEQAISYRSTLFLSSFSAIPSSPVSPISSGKCSCECNSDFLEGPRHWLLEQSSRVAYVFTNCDPLLDSAAPTLNRVIDIAHLGQETPKELDEHWKGVLSRRPQTILLSFGSVVKSYLLPEPVKMSILKTIAAFPDVTFIWKYENTEDEFSREKATEVENLVITQWMPQKEILSHNNVVAFITHGGMASLQETARSGVPGIFIPIFGDQPKNARMMEMNGLGVVFDKFDLDNSDKLTETIREIVRNPKYRTNSRRISRMLAAQQSDAREKLVRHVEFAAEFGPSTALRPRSLDMSFVEYHDLDIIALLMFLLALTARFIMFLWRRSLPSKPKSD